MRILAGIILLILASQNVWSQENEPILTPYDSVMLMSLPDLNKAPVLKSSDLPYYLDNSRLAYFRPIYEQVASECSQVSAIAYNYTYEINRFRDLPSDHSANQYPTHFVYNFANGGYGWSGVSYFHSFEIVKTLGCPDVPTYGGMAAGGLERWMSGYDNYLAAMSNRIQQVYQINVGTEQGLMQLKQWLHNHLEGSETGGVASFYSNSPWNMKNLPEGSPDEGKKVIVEWKGLPTHAMTITGYNDSIRWDYNEDGAYTNHIDINGDGAVNIRDWEIGGLIFVDGWQGGINFGDSGRCYMMYKTLAENVYEGGIWNNVVHVLEVRSIDKPDLSARVSMVHDRRNAIKVSCGVSSSISDTKPEYIIDFPVFNFQGGAQYMQGGTEVEENKEIEFGLDITPLLGLLNEYSNKKFYLVVEERDPDNLGSGFIKYFSVTDHTAGVPIEHAAPINSVPIENNGFTYIPLLFPSELEVMNISTEELPIAVVGSPYSFQLEQNGGDEPVQWELIQVVSETATQSETDTSGNYLEPEHWKYGNIPHELPFSFNFYGDDYDSIYIHPSGFIMFENTTNPWPYIVDPDLFVRKNKCIAPLLCIYLTYVPQFGQGMWIEEDNDLISITWRGEADYHGYKPMLEFAVELHKDGSIIFIYGNEFNGHILPWSCGISTGNGFTNFFPEISRKEFIVPGSAVNLSLMAIPKGMSFSSEGIFSGTPPEAYETNLLFCAEDHRHVRTYKALNFKASGLGISEADDETTIQIYPNPTSGAFHLRYSLNETQKLKFELFALSGVRVKILLEETRQTGEYEHRIDPGSMSPGVYFLKIRIGNRLLTKKLIYTGM